MQTEVITRVNVPELDAILGKPFKVLDDGFIRVVDYMGSDASIVQAARVSYGDGTKHVSEDKGLIRYLMRHRHSTPFEMCELKLHVRCPMDCWRQWIRHRTANVNEYSTRYSVAIDSQQKASRWREQASGNKQGSSGTVDSWPDKFEIPQYLDEGLRTAMKQAGPAAYLSKREEMLINFSKEIYEERIEKFNVAREQARKDLPLSTYTEAYWKCDLHNIFHFLGLRMDSHAQEEIRDYATVLGEEIVAKWCPFAWEAFKDYRLGSLQLSAREREVIFALNKPGFGVGAALEVVLGYGWLETEKTPDGQQELPILKRNRERAEFEAKAANLGIALPWVPKQLKA